MKRMLITGAAVVLAGAAFAQSGGGEVPPAVGARQGLMENFAFSLGTLGGMARGNAPYDAELAQAAADRLVLLSTVPQAGYWPEGTSSEEIEGTRALPAIWENMEDFLGNFDDLNQAATSMAEVAGDGQEAMAQNMGALGGACGSCHEDYRMADD